MKHVKKSPRFKHGRDPHVLPVEAVDAAGLLKCDLSVAAIGHSSVQPLPSLCPGQQGHTGGPESPAKFFHTIFMIWNSVFGILWNITMHLI